MTLILLKNIFKKTFPISIAFPVTGVLMFLIVLDCTSNTSSDKFEGRNKFHKVKEITNPINRNMKKDKAFPCSFNNIVSL